jgi:hypothetical protein
MSQAWPRDVKITYFMFNLLDCTSLSISVLPVLSISFSNGTGINTAKGTFFLMSSAILIGSLSA